MNEVLDMYYNEDYCKLYEEIENGKFESFVFEHNNGKVINMYIKKRIKLNNVKSIFYSIKTPYGYGGPLITQHNGNDEKLAKEYSVAFKKHCTENNVVFEDISFHPIFDNASYFASIYELSSKKITIGTNLKDFEDPFQQEFAKSMRKDIRNAYKKGVKCIINKSPDSLDTFKSLYYETLKRNNANTIYYFSDNYFSSLIEKLGKCLLEIQLVFRGRAVASELYFIKGNYMHAHLLASSEESLLLNANGVLEAEATKWGKENGYQYIHHGGGRTSDPNDSLLLYKKKFGKNTEFQYFKSRVIFLENYYNQYISQDITE